MSEAYKDPTLPVAERVADLLGRMTLKEKIGQLNQRILGWHVYKKVNGKGELTEDFKKMVTDLGIGGMYGLHRADPWSGVTLETGLASREGAALSNAVQRFAIENTRLGIPLMIAEDCPHGFMSIGATVLPVGLQLASSWNPELAEKAGAVAARECRAKGGNVGYGPVVDIARDPRWSRVEEGFGEDPYLSGKIAAAMVRGMQGETLAGEASVLSTLKHFSAYGAPEGGHNSGPAHLGEREMRTISNPPFQRGVEAGAGSLMASYNEIDGVPCHVNHHLLTELLRGEWGFEGFVVADMTGIDSLIAQGVAADHAEAAAKALRAGVDLSLWDESYAHLLEAVERGLITEKDVDRAASRVLRAKFMLGLFENPYVDEAKAEAVIGTAENRAVALEIARQGMILLKNEKGILPLAKDIPAIAVIGPNADNMYNQLGDYTAPQPREKIITVRDGIKQEVGAGTQIHYAQGCRIKNPSQAGFAEAVAAAKKAKVVVVVVGGSSARDFGMKYADTGAAIPTDDALIDIENGEGSDRSNLGLAGAQLELLKAVKATGAKLVVVLIQGRPYSIPWIAQNAEAIVNAWYPGEMGGRAVAEVLFGEVNPAGRLPISSPKSAAQLPDFYNHTIMARRPYVFDDAEPLYGFGHGLSYTSFGYANLKISPAKMQRGESCQVSVEVTNTGARSGDEVVQLYAHDVLGSVTRPERELKGFRRIRLEPGETKTVTLTLTPKELERVDIQMQTVVEPGVFKIMVGGGQRAALEGELRVLE